MPADPRRAKDLFVAALDLPDRPARDALLDRECAGDVDLRRRVDALLAAHEQPASALERPLGIDAPTGAFEPRAEAVGTVIAGKYKLLEPIGEGGMGEVWVADQLDPIRRRVALKVIKAGMDSRSVLARFEAERQALALMDHPNIARVLDAGATADGRPYFAMELVKGTPITEFCDARKLSPRERLELFVPVCQAIQHAHQKGIIHRDIKPSNVLVALHDERPVPKVIDFGVAKAIGQQLTEKTLYTGFGALVGTPAYMAPEQATFNQLDVDTRADVYALGVLLYELLAGSPPFEPQRLKTAALDEVLRLVREEEPPRPSQRLSTSEARASIAAVRQSDPDKLTRLVRGELDWIVMKALEKDRSRRYETATGFAADVQRYLAGEAVQAVPPSAGYRLRKFARKNRGPVLASALVALVLVGGTAGTAVGLVQADRARRAEADQRAAAERDRDEKEQARAAAVAEQQRAEREKARADDETAIAKAVNDFLLEDLLKPASWGPRALNSAAPDPNVTVRALMERAEQRVGDRFRDRPLIEATIREIIARSYFLTDRRQPERAIANLARAADLKAAHFGPAHPKTLLARMEVAEAYMHVPGQSRERYQILDAVRDALAATPDPLQGEALSALWRLANAYTFTPEEAAPLWERYLRNAPWKDGDLFLSGRAQVLIQLASAYRAIRPADADRVVGELRDAVRGAAERVADRDQANRLIQTAFDLDILFHRPVWEPVLGGLRRRADRLEAAGDRAALSAWTDLGRAEQMAKRPADAIEAFERARTLLDRLDASGTKPWRGDRILLFGSLGKLYVEAGRPAAAVAAYERYWPVVREDSGSNYLTYELAHTAEAYRRAGRPADIIPLLREVLDWNLKVTGPRSWGTMEVQTQLALTYLAADRRAEALDALAGDQKRNSQTPDALRTALQDRARACATYRMFGTAADVWDWVVVLTPEPGPDRANALSSRAVSRVHVGQVETGLKDADEAAAGKVPGALYNAACAYAVASADRDLSPERTEELARRAVELLEQVRATGYFDDPKRAAHSKADPDLYHVRNRADFQALFADAPVEKAPPPRVVK
jgi:serine/threonine protein kinase/tetratricopeptide (TPR) repeat protein